MIHVYQKYSALVVLSFFFHDPFNGYYLRELARKLDMDPMTTKRALDILTEDGMLIKYHEKTLLLYKAALENKQFTFAKVSYNLSLIRDSELVDKILDQNEGVICICLFGSMAKGEDGPESDLDLLIISTSNKVQLLSLPDMGRDINPTILSAGQWSKEMDRNKPFYMEILRSGIEIYGRLPVMERGFRIVIGPES